jgi:hypothetical protein
VTRFLVGIYLKYHLAFSDRYSRLKLLVFRPAFDGFGGRDEDIYESMADVKKPRVRKK